MSDVFVIAEIGINHNGDLKIAKELIEKAKQIGCNAVKFQKRTITNVYTEEYLNSYRESPWGTTQRQQKEGLEFSKDEYDSIDAFCKEIGIEWFASAWDIDAQLFLRKFNLKYNKVASAMLTNHDFLRCVAEEKRYTFISTGMSSIEEISSAVKIFTDHNCPFELMHCNSTYPMEDHEANLLTIPMLRDKYSCKVGYSGHERGILISYTAALLGATSIERHVTLSRNMYGSDQKASLEMNEMEELVQNIRQIPFILGDGIKRITSGEEIIRKKLVG